MHYQNLQFNQDTKGLATITLNKPASYNALDKLLLQELTSAFLHCKEDNTIKVIILNAAGKGFCSGQDLKEFTDSQDLIPSQLIEERYVPLITLMRTIPKTIICALHGIAVGAGCSLVLACDVIVASKQAALSFAFIGIGLVPDSGVTYFLTRVVGRFQAYNILSLGKKLSAEEAYSMGMLNIIVEHDLLYETIDKLVTDYLQKPNAAIGLIKQLVNIAEDQDLQVTLKQEAHSQNIAAASSDFKEGVNAFIEKRNPVFNKS